jgi:hypothetical protein
MFQDIKRSRQRGIARQEVPSIGSDRSLTRWRSPPQVSRGGGKQGKAFAQGEPARIAEEMERADLSFFLRAVPAGDHWTWRLFARTGASGTPRLVHAPGRAYATPTEATDDGRKALALAAARVGLTDVRTEGASVA